MLDSPAVTQPLLEPLSAPAGNGSVEGFGPKDRGQGTRMLPVPHLLVRVWSLLRITQPQLWVIYFVIG